MKGDEKNDEMTMKKSIVVVTMMILAAFFAGCAKISSPTGGPRDTTPPKVLKMTPENQSVRFHDKQIRIYFDEIIFLYRNFDRRLSD